jgi:anti-sigma B factor antagonist
MEVRIPEATASGTPYVVKVEGDIDIATVGDLEEPVIGAIEQGRRPVILDLSDCVFIDSSGIRLLLRAQHALSDNGVGTHQLVVVARDHVARLLRLVALDKVVPLVESRTEAEGRLDLPTPA